MSRRKAITKVTGRRLTKEGVGSTNVPGPHEMVPTKLGRIFLFLALLTTAAACESDCDVKNNVKKTDTAVTKADSYVRALVVEISKNQARVISSKVVVGRLPPPPTPLESRALTQLDAMHIEFEVRSSNAPLYVGRTVVAFRPIVEGDIDGQPPEVDKRAIVIAVPTAPADIIMIYQLGPSPGRGGGWIRAKLLGEARLEGIK